MKFRFILILIAVLLANFLLSRAASAQTPATEVYVFPLITEATTCGTMTFGVYVRNVVNLTAFHLEIDFDPRNVQVTKVENGGFLLKPGELKLFEPTNGVYELTSTTGQILFGMAQQGTNGNPLPKEIGPEGAELIKITLKALKPGSLNPFTIDGEKSILVNWPDAFQIPFMVTAPGVVSTSSCAPTDIALSANTIENGRPAGTVVGTLTTTDPDSSYSWESFSYSLPVAPEDNALFAISGDKLITRFVADYGSKKSYSIQVRSTDAFGKIIEKPFTITVNRAPVIDPIPTQNATVGTMLMFTAKASDTDLPPATLTFSLQNAPVGAVINPTTGIFNWTPTADQGGKDFTVKVCVSDGSATTCLDVTIKVAAVVVPADKYKLYLPIIAR